MQGTVKYTMCGKLVKVEMKPEWKNAEGSYLPLVEAINAISETVKEKYDGIFFMDGDNVVLVRHFEFGNLVASVCEVSQTVALYMPEQLAIIHIPDDESVLDCYFNVYAEHTTSYIDSFLMHWQPKAKPVAFQPALRGRTLLVESLGRKTS